MSELDEERLRARLQQAADDVEDAGDPAALWRRASHRAVQRRRRRRAASAAAVVLVVAFGAAATLPRILEPTTGQGPGVAEMEPPPERPGEDAPRSDPGDGPGGTSDDGPRSGGAEVATCRNAEAGFAIDHPARWEVGGSACAQFGPNPDAAPRGAGGSDLPGIHVHGDVLAVSFDTHAQRILGDMNVDDVVASRRVTIDGHRALRWESVSSGEGVQPEGTRSTGWLIELGPDRVLTLTTSDLDEGYRDNVAALDRMARSVRSLDGS